MSEADLFNVQIPEWENPKNPEEVGYFLMKMEISSPISKGEKITVTYALPAQNGYEAKERMKLWVISKFPEQKEEIEKINTDNVKIIKLIKSKSEYQAMIMRAEESAK